PLPAHPGGDHKQFLRLPLRSRKSGPVVGAQVPIRWPHHLRIICVAWQVAQPAQLTGCVTPHFARLIAVVLVIGVQLVAKPKLPKNQRVRGEILHARVEISPRLVPQQARGVGVMAQVEAYLHKQAPSHPVQPLLSLIKTFIRIAALSESRRVADRETVARVHHHLWQLSPNTWLQECLLEGRWRLSVRALNLPSCRPLRHGQQIRSQKRLPAPKQPLLAGLARPEAVAPVGLRQPRQPAARRVPLGASPLQREPVPLGRLPIDAPKSHPLRSRTRSRPE